MLHQAHDIAERFGFTPVDDGQVQTIVPQNLLYTMSADSQMLAFPSGKKDVIADGYLEAVLVGPRIMQSSKRNFGLSSTGMLTNDGRNAYGIFINSMDLSVVFYKDHGLDNVMLLESKGRSIPKDSVYVLDARAAYEYSREGVSLLHMTNAAKTQNRYSPGKFDPPGAAPFVLGVSAAGLVVSAYLLTKKNK
jgi:hypothetical protein